MTKTYQVVLRSQNKITEYNYDATFFVQWESLLPKDVQSYNLNILFTSFAGNYTDKEPLVISIYTGSSSLIYDNGSSNKITSFAETYGDIYASTQASNSSRVTVSKPNCNQIRVTFQYYDKTAGVYEYLTEDTLTDMSNWIMFLNFETLE